MLREYLCIIQYKILLHGKKVIIYIGFNFDTVFCTRYTYSRLPHDVTQGNEEAVHFV